jgi:hypothetical protein
LDQARRKRQMRREGQWDIDETPTEREEGEMVGSEGKLGFGQSVDRYTW